jgi:MraZ protein
MDRQGRVLLPAYLRESIGLGNEAVVVGSRDHAEIWAPDRWATYRKELEDPQELAEAFEGLGI